MIDVANLKIIDRFPVSRDSDISVKYISPALSLPSASAETVSGSGCGKDTAVPPLVVSNGVVAQWDTAEGLNVEGSALGQDGKLNWVYAVPAQGKLNLAMKWDVIAPATLRINGL